MPTAQDAEKLMGIMQASLNSGARMAELRDDLVALSDVDFNKIKSIFKDHYVQSIQDQIDTFTEKKTEANNL